MILVFSFLRESENQFVIKCTKEHSEVIVIKLGWTYFNHLFPAVLIVLV